MNDKIVTCTIDGMELPLLFTLGAEMKIASRMGGMDALFDAFREDTPDERILRDELEKTLPEEERRKRAEEREKSKQKVLDFLPFVIATLAQQGQLYLGERNHERLITEQWIEVHAAPSDVEQLTVAMCRALSVGLGMQHEHSGNDDEDVVLESIEKN